MSKCKGCGQDMPDIKIEAEAPVIIGHTKRQHWFNYYKPILVGSPIYSLNNKLYLLQQHESNETWVAVKYSAESLPLI